jgi:hypothetical protein
MGERFVRSIKYRCSVNHALKPHALRQRREEVIKQEESGGKAAGVRTGGLKSTRWS